MDSGLNGAKAWGAVRFADSTTLDLKIVGHHIVKLDVGN